MKCRRSNRVRLGSPYSEGIGVPTRSHLVVRSTRWPPRPVPPSPCGQTGNPVTDMKGSRASATSSLAPVVGAFVLESVK